MCGRVDVNEMTEEITPEQMDGHIAAMRAEPWGESRADYRTAFLVWWLFNLLGSTDEKEKPGAEDFLNNLLHFIDSGSTKTEEPTISPVQIMQGIQ